MDKLMRIREVLDAVGLSRQGLYQKIRKGRFPKQIKIGEKATAWRQSEIEEWINNPMAWKANVDDEMHGEEK